MRTLAIVGLLSFICSISAQFTFMCSVNLLGSSGSDVQAMQSVEALRSQLMQWSPTLDLSHCELLESHSTVSIHDEMNTIDLIAHAARKELLTGAAAADVLVNTAANFNRADTSHAA